MNAETAENKFPIRRTISTEKPSDAKEADKFKSIHPGVKPNSTDFLRKRLQKGVRYFDSGDYNMAKGKKQGPKPVLAVGEEIPTPENIPHPHRKQSVPSKLADNPAHKPVEVQQ